MLYNLLNYITTLHFYEEQYGNKLFFSSIRPFFLGGRRERIYGISIHFNEARDINVQSDKNEL